MANHSQDDDWVDKLISFIMGVAYVTFFGMLAVAFFIETFNSLFR